MPLSSKTVPTEKVRSWQPADIAGSFTPAFVAVNTPAPDSISAHDQVQETALHAWAPIQFPRIDRNYSTDKQNAADTTPLVAQSCASWQPTELEAAMLVKNTPFGLDRGAAENYLRAEKIIREMQERSNQKIHQSEGKAREILTHAEAQALEVIQHAEAQAVHLTHQAYSAGLSAANVETSEMLQTASAIVEEVELWREGLFAQGEMMMLRLVIEIAQTMFGEGLPLDPDTLGQAFSKALSQAKTLGDLRVYVHPEDVTILSPLWLQQQTAFSGQRIELVPSEIIKRGGCFIEGNYGTVDARVETQLQAVKNTLLSETSLNNGEKK